MQVTEREQAGVSADQSRHSGAPTATACSNVFHEYVVPVQRKRKRSVENRYTQPVSGLIKALDGVSLEIKSGEFMALLGPNGSGKTTLLKSLATLIKPTRGVVRWWGQPALSEKELGPVRARLGVVFQSPALDDLLTVRENLETAASLYGLERRGKDEVRRRVERAAAALGLTDRLDQRVGTLSGGLARRTDLARALLHDPDLLLLDEPGTGLDLRSRGMFLDCIEQLARAREGNRENGDKSDKSQPLTIVLSTHLMDEAERADRVVMMHQGKVVADGTPMELRKRAGEAVVKIASPLTRGRSTDGLAMFKQLAEQGELGWTERSDGSVVVTVRTNHANRAHVTEGFLGALTREGVPFEFGPPTLADAYLLMTGGTLENTSPTGGEAAGGVSGANQGGRP